MWSRPRFSRFSLRALFVFMTLIAIGISSELRSARQQLRAFNRALEQGAYCVHYDYGWHLPHLGYFIGVRPLRSIILPETMPPDDVENLRKAFPKAKIWIFYADGRPEIDVNAQ